MTDTEFQNALTELTAIPGTVGLASSGNYSPLELLLQDLATGDELLAEELQRLHVFPLTSQNLEDARSLLQRALRRLQLDPSIASGDPERPELGFTYDDPILATTYMLAARQLDLVAPAATGEDLRKRTIWKWALVGAIAFIHRKDIKLRALEEKHPHDIWRIDSERLRIALLGDAGYLSLAQKNVLQMIRRRHLDNPFHLILHLGDTYFAGSPKETLMNLLGPLSESLGSTPKASLCGNHDLYYGAAGYLHTLAVLGQPGRYFSIENSHWRIACLDTSLALHRSLSSDAALDDIQLDWLNALMQRTDRRLVIMSHHFIVSDWENPARTLTQQLAHKARGNIFAWYWGHEHRCAAYGFEPHGFYGACVGNGAFLEKWSEPSRDTTCIWYPTTPCNCYDLTGSKFWPHGFLELEFSPEGIDETYHLEGGKDYSRRLPLGTSH